MAITCTSGWSFPISPVLWLGSTVRLPSVNSRGRHHADFTVGWGYVDIEIHTHKSRGLTRADAVLAARFDSRLSPGFQPLP